MTCLLMNGWWVINPVALRMAKTLCSFGRFKCKRFNRMHFRFSFIQSSFFLVCYITAIKSDIFHYVYPNELNIGPPENH